MWTWGIKRTLWRWGALGLLVGALLVPVVPAAAQSRPELGRPGQDPVEIEPGEILVKFKPGASGQAIANAHRQNGGQERAQIASVGVRVVSVPPGQERARAATYRSNPNVQFAEPNGLYYALGPATAPAPLPNDPLVGQQWQYPRINAFDAWATTPGSASVAIAILDTGIDQSHEDLKGKLVANVNFTSSKSIDDKYGHGTHVAGSAAAITGNQKGVAGTCRGCSLQNVKVLGDNGSGAWSGIASGIVWAADNGARVINLSLGSYSPSQTVELAVNDAWSKGAIVVAAAGNDGQDWGLYPAAYQNVIAVAATTSTDVKAGFSNFGAWVDLAAPGEGILSTATDHQSRLFPRKPKYDTLSGTSMATPHAAGVAGLVRSHCPAAPNNWVRATLESTASTITGTGSYWANGRVDARAAVSVACP